LPKEDSSSEAVMVSPQTEGVARKMGQMKEVDKEEARQKAEKASNEPEGGWRKQSRQL